jgi:hypothetical protein
MGKNLVSAAVSIAAKIASALLLDWVCVKAAP